MNNMEFNEIKGPDSYPTKRGQYLIIYSDGACNFYMIAYYWPGDDGQHDKGFYFDADCKNEANIEIKWGYKVLKWIFLKNLLSKDGEY